MARMMIHMDSVRCMIAELTSIGTEEKHFKAVGLLPEMPTGLLHSTASKMSSPVPAANTTTIDAHITTLYTLPAVMRR